MAELTTLATDLVAMWPLLLAVTALMSGVFIAAHHRQRYDLIDVFWAPAILVAGLLSVYAKIAAGEEIAPLQLIVITAVLVWAVRLASHIARRFVQSSTQDARYTSIIAAMPERHRTLQIYLRIYILQSLLAVLASTTVIAALSQPELTFWAILGMTVWLIGFLFELVADRQLEIFVSDPKNRARVLGTGLWRYSRHPNYFGEVLLWWGVWMVSIGTDYWIHGLVGVITITALIVLISGVPPAERRMSQKRGWQQYKASTSVFLPFSPRLN